MNNSSFVVIHTVSKMTLASISTHFNILAKCCREKKLSKVYFFFTSAVTASHKISINLLNSVDC